MPYQQSSRYRSSRYLTALIAALVRKATMFPGAYSTANLQRQQDTNDEHARTPTNYLKRKAELTSVIAARPTRNRFVVPTQNALNYSLGLLRQPQQKIYKGLEYSSNQGSDNGAVILSRRIQRRDKLPDSLYVIQKEPYYLSDEVRTILKPMHDNIVTLYQVFYYEETLSFVYKEIDILLEQIFLLDVDPWSINLSQRDKQIASISQQVCRLGVANLYQLTKDSGIDSPIVYARTAVHLVRRCLDRQYLAQPYQNRKARCVILSVK